MSLLVGITSGEVENKLFPWSPTVLGQNYTYFDAVINNGGTPVMLPITQNANILREIYDHLGGILFAGGNDISPSLYHQEPHPKTTHTSLGRDKAELQLLAWAYEDKKPILAICRGMQLLNVFFGGTLHQNIPKNLPSSIDHINPSEKDMLRISHTLKLASDSLLSRIFESETIPANSYHHQAIDKLAPELKAVAWSEDGLIEGVEGKSEGFVIGVQCHPEAIEKDIVPLWSNLFTAFTQAIHKFEQAASYSSR
jgi:putative glutamine amidotransferase